MARNTKLAKDREAARRIAEMTSRSFEGLPKAEQKIRLEAIKSLRIRNRKTSKRSSTPVSLQERSEAGAVSPKRARP
jgi:hypothetical protein